MGEDSHNWAFIGSAILVAAIIFVIVFGVVLKYNPLASVFTNVDVIDIREELLAGENVSEFKDVNNEIKLIHFITNEDYDVEVKVESASVAKQIDGEVYNNIFEIKLINKNEKDSEKQELYYWDIKNGIIRFTVSDEFRAKGDIKLARYDTVFDKWDYKVTSYNSEKKEYEAGFEGTGIYAFVSYEEPEKEE